MAMFYEEYHSRGAHNIQFGVDENFCFPPHLHESFEFITVEEGKMIIGVDEKNYEVTEGKAVLVFPDQVHSLESVGHSRHFLCIFSTDFIKAYTTSCRDIVPVSNIFEPSKELLSALYSLKNDPGVLRCKGVLYNLAWEFDRSAEYRERSREKEALLWQIFDFVRKNYTAECTLSTLSEALSYHYAYLSRYFKERTGLSFTKYVNRYRISESCYKLTNTTDSVTKIALECGFDSVRSFHRHFKEQMGVSPGSYRLFYGQ